MESELPILRALWQRASEVVLREPGERFLSSPRPIGPYAREHWEFAWLSVAAYQKTYAGAKEAAKRTKARKRVPAPASASTSASASARASASAPTSASAYAADPNPDPAGPLTAAGWERWTGFPDDGLLAKIKATHLRVEVWERQEPPAVAVAFGGTVFTNNADWWANLRWFVPGHHDQYSDVVQTFAPAFDLELKRRSRQMDPGRLAGLELYSTGHSLGGGLAQQFAYSLPYDSIKHVKQVYAFDPSPVTGFYSVPVKLRDQNRRGMLIDRIYERGEILAILRSLTSLIYKPSAVDPAIRGVRYRVFRAWNAIAAHSIVELAIKLDAARGS
jgi:thioesterase domain-containing protein